MVIGITGGIGSGKSYLLSLMEKRFDCLVLEADQIARELQLPSGFCYPEILRTFGKEILDLDGQIDRQKLGEIVFSDREQLKRLNQIVHPAVKKTIQEKMKLSQREQPKRDIVIEAALLLEDRYDRICDTIWYIHSDEEIRRKRLKEFRGYSEEKITAVIKNQLSEEIFRKQCDCIIFNNIFQENREEELIKQIENCLKTSRQ